MLTGVGGETVRHYVGLFGDSLPCLTAVIVTTVTAMRMAPGTLRRAWLCLAIALALYFAGTAVCVYSWLHGIDPFPGPADFFFVAFYPF